MTKPKNPTPTDNKNLRTKLRDFWSFVLSIAILLVAAHWYFGVSEKIRAKGIHVYVDDVPKKNWLLISLFPLALPLATFLLVALLDLHAATFIAFTMLVWSSKDFVNIILVYRSPGNTVRDIEEGLFVVD